MTWRPSSPHVPGTLSRLRTDQLTPKVEQSIHRLLDAAFAGDEDDGFADEDWQHALGGLHFVLELEGVVRAHASVVERELRVGGVPLRTGYVEAVATTPAYQGMGLGS